MMASTWWAAGRLRGFGKQTKKGGRTLLSPRPKASFGDTPSFGGGLVNVPAIFSNKLYFYDKTGYDDLSRGIDRFVLQTGHFFEQTDFSGCYLF
jgi:hypothetical protein